MSEVDDLFKRLQSYKGVIGGFIMNCDGIAIRTTLDNQTTSHWCYHVLRLISKARVTVRDLDPQNDVTIMRLRTHRHEIIIAPDKDYMMVVIQEPRIEPI
ncbi:Dynein light chain 2B, cytoplasmic [Intoshia linei]|uniref:Dynein light chain roadblock n=1 Tax=Intoshia linei TaxID=1819745 RepID=A0A177B3Q0_9BILA|nr:Dynein light chain 2B, cytoplasmic [Intoshia linei]